MFACVGLTVVRSTTMFSAMPAAFVGRIVMRCNSDVVWAMLATFLSVSCLARPKAESKTEDIPLDEIWAWRIPGTKNVGTLDAVKIGGTTEHPILHDIFAGIGPLPKGEKSAPAFVVEGVGKAALRTRAQFSRKG